MPGTRAGRPCACGTCPSIELTDPDGLTPSSSGSRVVLQAGAPGALLLLVVDDDQLGELELAPTSETTSFGELPDPSQLTYS